MNTYIKHNQYKLLFSLVISLVFVMPYLISNTLYIGHDTFFHLGRISNYSERIANFDLLPAIFPQQNNNYGYASPLFYCNILLLPFSLLHLIHVPLSSCYKLCIFLCTFLTSTTMFSLFERFNKNKLACSIGTYAYLFTNYRISDVYIRGALGEVMSMAFLALLLTSLYDLFVSKKDNSYLLAISLSGLIFSHNLSFLGGMIIVVIFTLVYLKDFNPNTFKTFLKNILLAFLLTLFFTLPMLEALSTNTMYVNGYSSFDLTQTTLTPRQYLQFKTIFGFGPEPNSINDVMNLTPGYVLMFVPLLYLFSKNKDKFSTTCFILGYAFLLHPCSYNSWMYIDSFNIMQFSWRFLMLACLFLSIAFVCTLKDLNKPIHLTIITSYLIVVSMIHLQPCTINRFPTIDPTTTRTDIVSGKVCDPYYSSTFQRVELAGADYLPSNSLDFRSLSTSIKDGSLIDLDIPYTTNKTGITFTTNKENQTLILPKTYYSGYTCKNLQQPNKSIPIKDTYGLIEVTTSSIGTYSLQYQNTPLRNLCILISFLTLIHCIYAIKHA